jgi:hypothetical protein
MYDLNTITNADLVGLQGRGIANLCDTGYADANMNHCAHFVGHALGVAYGRVCGDLGPRRSARGFGASVRVNEVFNRCTERGR